MCNRFRANFSSRQIEEQFRAWDEIDDQPRFNVAPTQPIVTIRQESNKRKVSMMRWGLIPSWASGITSANFNARSETITTTASFRDLLDTRRCLIPADAFYEWQKIGSVKQPFAFEVGDGELFAFAGLWDEWKGSDGKTIQSCTILTTEANALVAELHDRMPVILTSEKYEPWLNPDTPIKAVLELLKPFESASMRRYPVSTKLNDSKNETAEFASEIQLDVPEQTRLF